MRLGVVVTNYSPHLGGVEAHVQALAAGLVSRGVPVTVVCLGPQRCDEVRDDGVRVVTLRRRLDLGDVVALPDPADWRAARRALADSGLTHVSVHTRYFPMTWAGVRLAKDLGVPSVLTEHGGGPVATSSATVTRAAAAVDRTAGRRALRRAGVVLAVSAASAAFVRRLSGRSAAVLGNGADAAFWSVGGEVAPRRHLVFAGRLVAEKGWPDFLAVLAAAPPDVTATVAGDGPDRRAVAERVRDLSLGGRVDLPGRLGPADLRAAYAGSVYVNPSTAAEGFQTTLLEAGLAGARIATYDVGGAAEVVGSGGAHGLVVGSGDVAGLRAAVSTLLDDDTTPPTADALRHYDWPAVTRRFHDVLLAAGGARR